MNNFFSKTHRGFKAEQNPLSGPTLPQEPRPQKATFYKTSWKKFFKQILNREVPDLNKTQKNIYEEDWQFGT